MDLAARKYLFIQELIKLNKESVLDTLERVLKLSKEQNVELSAELQRELDKRLESYLANPENVLDWNSVKHKW